MKNNVLKNFTVALTSLLLLALVFSFLGDVRTAEEPTELTISQLVAEINAGNVTRVDVNGNNLEIDLADGKEGVAKKEFESSLSETLANYEVDKEALSSVVIEVQEESTARFWLGLIIPSLLPLLVLIGIFWFVFRGAKGGQNQVLSFGKANIKKTSSDDKKVTFDDVAGVDEVKTELMELVDFLKNPKKFLDIGAKIPRGVLLMGAPGSGKTLLARAVAGESGVPFFYISASEFVEMFVGVGASRIRDAFATAKKHAPAILFIDEIDAIGRQRGTGLGGGHDEREQTLNQILVEMDGFDQKNRVIVLAATNRPDVLDAALLRPGRFDRRISIDLPDRKDREAILKIHARNKPLAKGANLAVVAKRTPGFSGADLENVLNEAAILAARESKKSVRQQDLLDAIEKVLMGPARKGRMISDEEKKLVAYHEAGHALVAASLKESDPVHKITIISRGRAGGYTMKLPSDENRLRTRKQMMADLATMMGGYASEQIMFSDISTGASNDLKEAEKLSRKMVTRYGMSDEIGPVTFNGDQDQVFLGREIANEKHRSEKMNARIDDEVSRFLHDAHKLAQKIIESRKKLLDAIADALLEKETLEEEEFAKLMKGLKLKQVSVTG